MSDSEARLAVARPWPQVALSDLHDVIRDLEGDVALARTRDESMRLTRRVLALQRIAGQATAALAAD